MLTKKNSGGSTVTTDIKDILVNIIQDLIHRGEGGGPGMSRNFVEFDKIMTEVEKLASSLTEEEISKILEASPFVKGKPESKQACY